MLSYALSTGALPPSTPSITHNSLASSYFHLPVDEQEDQEIAAYHRKRITYVSSSASASSSSTPPTPSTSNNRDSALSEILATDDLYSILGVTKSDNLDKLKLRRAYLRRSRACHPDKFPNNPEATHAFQKIAPLGASYDLRPSKYDVFSAHPTHVAQETFRSIVMGVFDDFLEGDLEMIRTLLKAVNDINPSLSMGDEGINSILNSLQRIRERALTCRTCIYALHAEMTRVLEIQHSFRQLSFFDLRTRTRLIVELTRITLSLPLALERAIVQQNVTYTDERTLNSEAILPQQVTILIRGVDVLLQHMEKML
ncbi:hypothetical protein C8F01DRAFT_1332423 [Mycena amicta]|nr:hypothetical protein C8F01DRAFT_1332423 [Mycena amicta]